MRDYFFEGIRRLDWGFNNPNITAGLIVTLMMAIWILFRIHRWGFWPSLIGFTALGVCLIQTASRGGLVAVIVSGVVMVSFAERPWPKIRWLPLSFCIFGLMGYAFFYGVASRYSKGIVEEDGSVSNRWLIYRMTPAMMADAPGGWGLNQGSEAFHNFYQPEGRLERYGSLVSSHLTWMVEFSWLGRFGYFLAWFSVFLLALPTRKRTWYSVVFATWVAFGVSAMFTTMANRWLLWIIPGFLFLGLSVDRFRLRDFPQKPMWLIPPIVSLVALGLFYLFGSWIFPSMPAIDKEEGWVEIGRTSDDDPVNWVISPDASVLGTAYGHKIRGLEKDSRSSARSVKVEWGGGKLAPKFGDRLFVSGVALKDFKGDSLEGAKVASEWVFLNPSEPAIELVENIEACPPIRVLWGEFFSGRARLFWQLLAKQHVHVSFEKVDAAGKYLPDWPQFLYEEFRNDLIP